VRPWVVAFDAGLCADPLLAGLPGRFLVTLDDGRGDVAGLRGDVGLLALTPGTVALTLGGADSGLRATPRAAVPLTLAAPRAFLPQRAAPGGTAGPRGAPGPGASSTSGPARRGPRPGSGAHAGSPARSRPHRRPVLPARSPRP